MRRTPTASGSWVKEKDILPGHNPHEIMTDKPTTSSKPKNTKRPPYLLGGIIVVAVAALVIVMSLLRNSSEKRQEHQLTADVAKGPIVQTARVIVSPPEDSVQVEGDARPYQSATLYAKLSGYLNSIRVDKGDHVSKNELLATIESPETDRQYLAAVAVMRNDSQIAVRDYQLYKKALMSQQEYEQATFTAEQARQTVEQYKSLKSYEEIRAPFMGTVTARYADPGSLVQNAQNGATSSLPIVSIADLSKLRIELYLDQRYAAYVHTGDQVKLMLPERSDFAKEARITRSAEELDVQSRMMLVEVETPNRRNEIVPGSTVHALVHVKHPRQLQVPVSALIVNGNNFFVGEVVNGNLFRLDTVTVGKNYGETIEIVSGLTGNEIVALNVGKTLSNGAHVQVAKGMTPAMDSSNHRTH
ncbi:MAG TPA: efflux RND transporter periplasmic adaptor subunit [Candidatus Kapabacteria bacterium]|jgi:RND family efflux transporter MFP subunit|nr:efflux RND transporter periplasmic adaptor subunit [Candidatus Kapabacteria bacterium]